jgi:hypothetical protein
MAESKEQLTKADIVELASFFDLLARFDYEDSLRKDGAIVLQVEPSDILPIVHRTDTQ